jgi:type III restriction enzyme
MPNEYKPDILKDLTVSMTLRKPQREALGVFAEVLDLLKWEKVPYVTQAERSPQSERERIFMPEQIAEIDGRHSIELAAQLDRVREKFLTVTSFEREFPSICFALATGVGKTRLMAAIMVCLHHVKKVNNFFVVAPNRTIYDKLKRDFSQNYHEKYVFSGLYDFVAQPTLIDGDNFNNFNPNQMRFTTPEMSAVSIHIFNIAKLTHGRGQQAEMTRVMRLHEVLGQSYFDFLRSLPDLCVMMDESHHYHAEQGFGVINDLNPMIGV